jgi:tryptophanyl-tRNA synthetase
MSVKLLGETYDIHGGGADLMFPHHENELAQGVCAHKGSEYAKIWVHNGFLTVEGEKMSKSLGNTIGLLESREQIWEKLRPAMTDAARVRKSDPGTPEVCNVYSMHKAFSDTATQDTVASNCRTAAWGCIECKKVLAESMEQVLVPIRVRAAEIGATPSYVTDVLEDGAQRARTTAQETMRQVYERMGLTD